MAFAKYLINSLDDAVSETLSGLCLTYPSLRCHVAHKVVLSPHFDTRANKVAIMCGGGSGHEPFAAGFVGDGMLTASVAGSIFAAPPSTHISYALQRLGENNKAGIFVVIPNYTGDRLNFGIAIERARQTGLKIAEIIVGEDCSIPEEEQSAVGKRGLCGMLFIIKIAGALAENGHSLSEISNVAEVVLKNTATYAVGLTACSIPGQGLMFHMQQDEMECGMGIHGEAGYERRKLGTASEVMQLILARISNELSLTEGDFVAVIVNNFGALSQLEQGIVSYELVTQLEKMGVRLARMYSGTLMTSLNSAGTHVCIFKLPEEHRATLISCLDEPTNAPCWPGRTYTVPLGNASPIVTEKQCNKEMSLIGKSVDKSTERLIKNCLQNSCQAMADKEAYLNELDRGCGDGDCGTTLKRLAEGVLRDLDKLVTSHPATLLAELANIAEETMGGTSGALYCLFFMSAAKELASVEADAEWRAVWPRVFRSAAKHLMKYGKANVGDRTMLDTMHAACTAYETGLRMCGDDDLCERISDAAWEGCEMTRNMKPRAGRASYVKQVEYLKGVDAGAYAAAIWISTVAKTVKNFRG